MSIEKDLLMYTDLTPARYAALKDIQDGRPAGINGYTRCILKDLLTGDCALNTHGANVLKLATEIVERHVTDNDHRQPYPVQQEFATMALHIRKNTRFHRIKAKHLRALVNLYERPGVAYRWFAGAHGFDIVEDLILWGLVDGMAVTGSQFRLTVSGKLLIEKEW